MPRLSSFKNGKMPTHLSPAETKVAALLVEGISNKEIAAALHIAVTTVKFHITSIYKITGLTTRAAFITNYYNTGDYYSPQREKK